MEFTDKQLLEIKHILQLRKIVVGATITQEMYDALRFVAGDFLDIATSIKERAIKINFDSNGKPYTLDTDVLDSYSVDGGELQKFEEPRSDLDDGSKK